jgi:hypothetical protein
MPEQSKMLTAVMRTEAAIIQLLPELEAKTAQLALNILAGQLVLSC